MPSGRTSMPGLQATDLLATLPACSGRRHNQLCRLSHERKLGDQTKDDADKGPREERSCGRSQTSLYNGSRPHSQLGWKTPSEFAFTFHPRRVLSLRYAKLFFSARAGCRLPQFSAEKFGICLLGERCMLLRITSARVAESDNLLKSSRNAPAVFSGLRISRRSALKSTDG